MIAAGALTFNTFFIYLPSSICLTIWSRPPPAHCLRHYSPPTSVCWPGQRPLWRPWAGYRTALAGVPSTLGSIEALIVFAVPMSLAAESGSLLAHLLAEVMAGIAVGGALSVLMLAEMFPTDVRATGLSMMAGLATALVGGTAPLLDRALCKATGLKVAPALYVTAVAGLAFVTLRSWPETAFKAFD